jgi:hypothetical protein
MFSSSSLFRQLLAHAHYTINALGTYSYVAKRYGKLLRQILSDPV